MTYPLDRLRLVTSQGPPYPSRSPRAHPSGWTMLVSYRPLAGLELIFGQEDLRRLIAARIGFLAQRVLQAHPRAVSFTSLAYVLHEDR